MYLDHRTVDGKFNIIVDCHLTPGNIHDSVPYIDRLEYIQSTFGFEIKKVALDSGYNSLDIKKYLLENRIFGVIGYRRFGSSKSRENKRRFEYCAKEDIYIEKETGEILEYSGNIDRNGYKKYENLSKDKKLLRHIMEEINEKFNENRLSEEGRKLYKKRKEKIERSFADSKQNHGYCFAIYRGLNKNQDYTWLICAAQNMKNISIQAERYGYNPKKSRDFLKNVLNLIISIFFYKETPSV